MTPEEQRIAIAEACGWKKVRMVAVTEYQRASGITCDCLGVPPESGSPGVPDYLNDLNAMHEATACLDKTINQKDICLRDVFSSELEEIFSRSKTEPEIWSMFDLLTASASQRAEAFLRTLNLWKD